jgi:hypothetical protein
MAVSSRSSAFLPVVRRAGPEDPGRDREVRTVLSPHISSAFAQERQTRYRREAEAQRLARRRERVPRRAGAKSRTSTEGPPGRIVVGAHASPAH